MSICEMCRNVRWQLLNAVGSFGQTQHVHTSAVKASHLSRLPVSLHFRNNSDLVLVLFFSPLSAQEQSSEKYAKCKSAGSVQKRQVINGLKWRAIVWAHSINKNTLPINGRGGTPCIWAAMSRRRLFQYLSFI